VDLQLLTRTSFLDREDGQKPVYEAWGLRLPADELIQRSTWSFLGAGSGSYSDGAAVVRSSMHGEQSDLAKMHLGALEEFQKKNRGGWASRMLKGKRKTYEQHIDERCRKLPLAIQEAIYDLLETRGHHCSTMYRNRKWTVAVMGERERYRFGKPELAETKRHRLRFWKNSGPAELLDYFVVIRGSEIDACADPRGFSRFLGFTNPWMEVDIEEVRQMGRERVRMFDEQREKIAAERRKRSLSPPSYWDWRDRSPSPEREPDRRRYQSPPSYRPRRDRSPMSEPETEVEARRYIRMTRAAARNAPPSVPMAPEMSQQRAECRYAPPPLTRSPSPYTDRSFSRPRVPYVEDNTWTTAPQYDQVTYPRPTVSVYAPQHFGVPSFDVDGDSMYDEPHQNYPPPRTPVCIACQVTPECGHYSRSRVCDRPINWRDDIATHPPCFICMATAVPADSDRFDFLGQPMPPQPASMSYPMPPCMMYAPPPYPPTEVARNDAAADGDANDLTDIESDGGDLDDGASTAVGESPIQPQERPKGDE